MNNITQMHLQEFNALFSELSALDNIVFWVSSLSSGRNYYLSPAFEKIWGRNREQIASELMIFSKALSDDEYTNIHYYRIVKPNSDIQFIRVTSFLIRNAANEPRAVVGICRPIEYMEWELKSKMQRNKEFPDAFQVNSDINKILNESFPINSDLYTDDDVKLNNFQIKIDDDIIDLSMREAECLYHLCNGKHTKKIADIMSISTRTVEAHFNRIRAKTNSANRVALLGKITNKATIKTWGF